MMQRSSLQQTAMKNKSALLTGPLMLGHFFLTRRRTRQRL